MSEVSNWLNHLGLGQYAKVFEAHKIDPKSLAALTAGDLKKIGIPSDDREKLLNSIAASAAGDLRVEAFLSDIAAPNRADAESETRAERRQVTVMFCDLVGSTQLSELLDPEDLAGVINTYRAACDGVVRRFGGFIAKYMSDGILVCFGYPKAHEDDAERSIRTSLEIVRCVSKLSVAGANLGVRIGIATGSVVVGDIFEGGSAEANAILGHTPNLAARLQEVASPGSVIISATTQRLVLGKFLYEDLGALILKGLSQPVRAFRVISESDTTSRFEGTVARGLTPFVGREEDMHLLVQRWELARAGQGQMVLMSGEAGIGKSRLIREFRTQLGANACVQVQLQCSPYHQHSALHPVIEWLESALANRGEETDHKLDKLRSVLADLGLTSDDHLVCMALLLGVPLTEHYSAYPREPDKLRRFSIETLLTVFLAEAHRQPLLIVVEDMHWCDPSTVEFLNMLAERLRRMPALIVATFRPGFNSLWRTDARIAFLPISKLSSKNSSNLIATLAGGAPLPDAVREEILVRSDGVPLFVEELTRAVIESETLQRDDRRVDALRRLSVPSSLQDSLVARLDQLPSSRRIVQLASLLGRTFSYRLLAAIVKEDDGLLKQALADLVGAGILVQQGSAPESVYEFRHVLVQDAAQQLLLNRTRQNHHARIAEVLEEQFPDTAKLQPEILAHHWTEAQQAQKAVHYWLMAGQHASERSAMVESARHLQRGLELIHQIPDSTERNRVELEMQILLAGALIATAGPGAQDVKEAYERALLLCEELPPSPLHFAAVWGSWRIAMEFNSGRERADKLLELASNAGDGGLMLQALHCQWATLFNLGEFDACYGQIKIGLKLYDAEAHSSHARVYGAHDAKVCALGEAGLCLQLRGHSARALRHAKVALAWARRLHHSGSIAHALDYAAMLSRYRRDARSILEHAEDMIRFSEEEELVDHGVKGRFFRGYALAQFGQVNWGLSEMREAMEAELSIGTKEDFPVYFEMLAEVAALAGSYDEALHAIERGALVAEQGGIRYWSAELHRRRGEILRARCDKAGTEAEHEFRQAFSIAREQKATLLELRALCSLVRVRGRPGSEDRDYDLRTLVSSFPEQRDTPDLTEAKALLSRL